MTTEPPWRPDRAGVGSVAVARSKFDRELGQWQDAAEGFRARGIILSGVADRWAELTLLMAGPTPTVAACIGIDYVDYDLHPPSVTFLDPLTRMPGGPVSPPLQLDGTTVRPLLLAAHPRWRRPFLCLPGTFEYHTHPQHDGDPWLGVRRSNGEGRLDVLTNHLWDVCVRDRGLRLGVESFLRLQQPPATAEADEQKPS